MTSPYPMIGNGLGQPQGIWDVTTSAEHRVGTRGFLDDGRVFYYSRAVSATPIVAGNVLQRELTSVDWDNVAVNTALAGDTSLLITPDGTKTYTANELSEGYVIVDTSTGIGKIYKIKSHAAVTAATEFECFLYDAIHVGFASGTTVTVIKNSYMDPIVASNTVAYLAVGVSNVAVPDGSSAAQYFWTQTWGMAAVTSGATSASGALLMVDTTTAGETLVATAGIQTIGVNIFTSANATACPVYLQIAP
ncbi:MAG: hypothetical protein E4H28_04930 [Gemmatimonadales bacterium]|nr:MAG: hypothetical protein E4H28_04930 [Gemmatimonadales bacterium]